ncbi:MAG: histidine phosphatase family protein [Chloroflexi bacterium]|nr:histidine phosphatase family protein [Chloroflexota bacterium]
MDLYIIRHGQSTNNVIGDSSADYEARREADPPLTDLGKQQAEAVARYLAEGENLEAWAELPQSQRQDVPRGFGLTHLYASPMLRALQTAQPIARAFGLPVEVWIELHEHGGMYIEYPDERGVIGHSGRRRSEIQQDFPDYVLPDELTEEGWWNPANLREDITGAYARAMRVAAALRRRASTQERIALVTHGTFAECLIKALLNMLPSPDIRTYLYNTSVSHIHFYPSGNRITLRYINRVQHLPPEMVS